jgi:glutamate-ammonia-ligase adenylyltransferase
MHEIEKAIELCSSWSSAFQRSLLAFENKNELFHLVSEVLRGNAEIEVVNRGTSIMESLRIARRKVFCIAFISEEVKNDVSASFALLTSTAESFISTAFSKALRESCDALGVRPNDVCRFAVLGFGKLGAMELNPSSDVDIMLVYESDKELGSRTSTHELFARVARRAGFILSTPTELGFCLRTDYDLRPEGATGPLCNSLEALVSYYEGFGSPLDRLAWTRARPVAGDKGFGEEVIRALRPFVYPRTVVEGALEAISKVLGKLRKVARDNGVFDVKRGYGGIRDIELCLASYQLIYGGRIEPITAVNTVTALSNLSRVGLLSEGRSLCDAYLFLRRIEHLVQYQDDRQTHEVRLGDAKKLAVMLGQDEKTFLERLANYRDMVSAVADRLFGLGTSRMGNDNEALETLLWASAPDGHFEKSARALGFHDAQKVFSCMEALRNAPHSPLHPKNIGAHAGFDKVILRACSACTDPDEAIGFASRIMKSAQHKAVIEICTKGEAIFGQLVFLGSQSPMIGRALIHDPALASEITLSDFKGARPDIERFREQLDEQLKGKRNDEEFVYGLLKAKRHALVFLAIKDIDGQVNEEEVGRSLADCADAIIARVLEFVGLEKGLAVLALGRLGGRELGYNSDLDLVFVCKGKDERVLDGVRRFLKILTTPSTFGPLYQTDLRLRPSGSQGPLVVEAEQMWRFYEDTASIPELLGAMKLRFVAGDEKLGNSVVGFARKVAQHRIENCKDFEELLRIRELQHLQVANKTSTTYNPKLESGGMLDIETIARVISATKRKSTKEPESTLEVLRVLKEDGKLKGFWGAVGSLEKAYRFLLRLSNWAYLVLDMPISSVRARGPKAQKLALAMGFAEGAEALWKRYREALSVGRDTSALLFVEAKKRGLEI